MSSYQIEVVICGTEEAFRNTKLNVPLRFKILLKAHEIIRVIDEQEPDVRFIILFLDLYHPNMETILYQLSERNNIVVTLVCDDVMYDSSNNLRNVVRISPHMITNEITFRAINAYESSIPQYRALGREKFAMLLEETANDLKRWYMTNSKVESSHIIIVSLNTDHSNLIDCQQNLIDFFKRLYPTKTMVIRTINDYVTCELPPNDQNILSNSSYIFRQKLRQTICDNIHDLALIILFLTGNETHIPNEWSKYLIKKELDNDQNNIFKYVERCAFIENEPIVPYIRNNLAAFLGYQWQVTDTIPKRLDDLESDEYFHHAIQYVYDTLEIRQRKINLNICEKFANYRDTTPDYSSEFKATGYAQSGPQDRDQPDENSMDTSILSDYPEPPIN